MRYLPGAFGSPKRVFSQDSTIGNDLIRRLLKKANQSTKRDVEQLINGGTITKPNRQELTYREVEDSIDNIWSVLYTIGYLTCHRRVPGKKRPRRTLQGLTASARHSRPAIPTRSRRCSVITCGISSVCGIPQCAGT